MTKRQAAQSWQFRIRQIETFLFLLENCAKFADYPCCEGSIVAHRLRGRGVSKRSERSADQQGTTSSEYRIHEKHLPGGMWLAPHLVCKTSVTVKNLPAEQRLVATHKVQWLVRFLLSLSTCFFHFLIATIVIPRWGIFVNSIIVALPRTVNRNYKEMLYG